MATRNACERLRKACRSGELIAAPDKEGDELHPARRQKALLPLARMVLSQAANGYSRIMLGVGVNDITAGYRAYRREVLEKIDLAAVDSKGYCFQIDLTWRTINNGFVVVEVPITFTEREFGVSKMSGSNIREAMFRVAQWGIRGRIDRARGVGVTR